MHSEFKAAINFNQAKLALLNLEGSTLVGATMNFLQIDTHLWLDGLTSKGPFNLGGANIGAQFAAKGAEFINPKGKAINAQGAEITGGVFLRGTKITGMAAFNSAKIGTQFSADGAEFLNPTGTALLMQDAVVKGATFLSQFPHPALGRINLHSAQFTTLVIDKHSYPLGRLILEGTRYTQLLHEGENAHTDCAGWLVPPKTDLRKRQRLAFGALFENREHFPFLRITYGKRAAILGLLRETQESAQSYKRSPFAYRQFAKTLDRNGHEREAREVRILAGDAYTNRVAMTFGNFRALLYKAFRKGFKCLLAYGVKPWHIFRALGLYWCVGFGVFWAHTHNMTPAKERYYMNGVKLGEVPPPYDISMPLPEGYPKYSPLIYALDVMLPIVDFAQESHWRPRNTDAWNWLRAWNRLYLIFGWFLSTIGIAGLTGLLQDKREP